MAIQHESVWDGDQLARLWDSVVRGCPIGSFRSWAIDGDHSSDVKVYGAINDYDELVTPIARVGFRGRRVGHTFW